MTLKLELCEMKGDLADSLGIYKIINKDGTYRYSEGKVEKIKTVTAGKVKNQTPKCECCLGKERHKISGRANKRMKYKKSLLNNK